MTHSRDAVITGLGTVSPIGIGYEEFWDALLNERSGVSIREPYAETNLPLRMAAPIKEFEAKKFVKPRKALKIMCNPIQFGCAAAAMAVDHAKLDRESLDHDRVGIVFGTETFFADPKEVADVFRRCTVDQDYQHDKWGEFAMREIQPLWMLKYLPNMAASHISIAIDARGPSNSICQGEASGLLALIEAADLIRRGVADVVVAGGTGSQMALTAMLYRGIHLLSNRPGDPTKASRPFDANRDGMIVGEGSAAIVLESREHAEGRGAELMGTIAGGSRSYQHPKGEFSEALYASFRSAIDRSEIDVSDIGLINAHASGSIKGDLVEAQAIRKLSDSVPVTAHKSNFGNIGPGASLVELIGAILSRKNGVIPATINCDQLDPECEVNLIRAQTPLEKGKAVLKSSFSATGQIASVVVV